MEQTLTVGLGERAYPIHIGSGILPKLGELLRDRLAARRYAVIADETVAGLYGGAALQSLTRAGLSGELFTFPPGEASKRLAVIEDLADRMARAGFDRSHAVLTLGGGVSGDMAGFLAAIYMRGIPFAQVPTTLLAQVDSSVGGKTGVDIEAGKNLVGAFHQPGLVLIDTDLLRTLPRREILGGMAEVIKYGASLDADFFRRLEQRRERILALDADCLNLVAARCCALKARVVEEDEREGGLRRVLNFGHTIGHAVEAASDFALPHGFAVSIGMCAATELAQVCGYAPAGLKEEIAGLLAACGLPTEIPPDIDRERVAALMRADKKGVDGRLFFVLPTALGRATITDRVDADELMRVIGLMAD